MYICGYYAIIDNNAYKIVILLRNKPLKCNMEELLGKISSYNLFTNLLPGILYVIILKELTGFDLTFGPVFLGLFFYYFIGVVINRIGSVIIEPLLIKCKFVTFIEYPIFIKACKSDAKIETLSENNNMCRSLVALCLALLISIGYEQLIIKFPFIGDYNSVIILIGLLLIFIFSYRKQTNFISKRCKADLEE